MYSSWFERFQFCLKSIDYWWKGCVRYSFHQVLSKELSNVKNCNILWHSFGTRVDQWDFLEIWLGADAAILKWNIAVAEFLKIILVCHSSMPKFWIIGLGRKIFPRILSFVFEHFSKNITTYAFLNSFVSVLSLLSSVLCCFLNKSENHFQNYYLAKKKH